MEMIPVVVYFNGVWSDNRQYENFEVTGILVPTTCTFAEENELICSALKIDNNTTKVGIKFHIKSNIPPISISDESTFRFFMELVRKSDEQGKFPLIIEKLYINRGITVLQSLTNVEEDINQAESPIRAPQWNLQLITPANLQIGTQYVDHLAIEAVDQGQRSQINIEYYEGQFVDVISDPHGVDVKVNQTYRGKKILSQAIKLHSIRQNRQHRVERSSSRDYVLVCIENETCNWKLRASKIRKTSMFKVRYFNDKHTCSSDILMGDHRQASSDLVSGCIMHRLTDLKKIYTPTDIMEDMMTEYNVSISYQKAWRSKEKALEKVRGSPHDYSLIPSWLHMLEKTNPGSVTALELETNGRFKYLFFAIGASIEAWQHCFPIIVIDGTFMQSTYGGTLLISSTQDANRNIVPIAFAVVDSENELSWRWFFVNLRKVCRVREGQCIVSDRHEAIIKGLNFVFPDVMHGSCTYHVLKNIKNRFKKSGEEVKKTYNGACRAYTIEEFNINMADLDAIDVRIRSYLEKEVILEKCTRLHGAVSRYSTMTSNTAESINNAIKGIRGLPITTMIECIRCMVQRWYFTHKQEAISTFTTLSKTAERMLQANIMEAKKLKVETSNLVIFTVYDVTKQFIVDMEQKTCTCNKFQYHEMPCSHAAAVISKRNLSCYDFCSKKYSKTTLVDTYSTSIFPLDDKENWDVPEHIRNICVKPPNTRRPTGRPKLGRYKHGSEIKIQNSCSRCKEKGHNRNTCKNPTIVRSKTGLL